MSEKLLRDSEIEINPESISTPGELELSEQMDQEFVADEPGTFLPRGEDDQRRRVRRAMDGGVRMAGGRIGERVADDFDQYSMSDGSILPPSYSSHFEDM